MVEVEWEDSASTQGWQTEDELPHPHVIHSVGYLERDDDEGFLLIESKVTLSRNPLQILRNLGYAICIPRSAIRNVWELRRKR